MKRSIIYLLVVAFLMSFSQSENDIYWKQGNLLKWDDFQGNPEENSPLAAATASGYGFESYTIKAKVDTVFLNINSYFTKNKSWVKQSKKTEFLLRHEQLHFSISELYCRKFKKTLNSTSFKRENFKIALTESLKKSHVECSAFQDLYDRETNHSKNKTKQAEWEKKIAKELKALEIFSETKIFVCIAK